MFVQFGSNRSSKIYHRVNSLFIRRTKYSVLENVDGGKICDMIEEKIYLIHEYARHTLYKCNTGYSLDGDQDESKFLKKRVESMRIFILKKLKCPF